MVLKNLFNYNLERVISEDVKNDRYVIAASTKNKKSLYITNHSGHYPNYGCNCHIITEYSSRFHTAGVDFGNIDVNYNKLLLYTLYYNGNDDYTIRDSDIMENNSWLNMILMDIIKPVHLKKIYKTL